MGRLPLEFAGKPISWRLPYNMSGEFGGNSNFITANQSGLQFPDAVFSHQIDKPFEIHRMLVRVTGFNVDELGNLIMFDPQPESLGRRIRLKVSDLSKNESMNKSATLVDLFLWDNTLSWDWEEPYTIVRSEGFQVQIDSQAFTHIGFETGEVAPTLDRVRVEVNFQGYLIVIAPPSETR